MLHPSPPLSKKGFQKDAKCRAEKLPQSDTHDPPPPPLSKKGFQKDAKWMYTGSEDGAIKIWDLRAPSCQRNYDVMSAVTTVALHPNQAELISGDVDGKIKVQYC